MQKITPFLWFDTQAEEAARLYMSLFRSSKMGAVRRYGDAGPGPKGTVMTLTFELEGTSFMALNGGPQFSFTPSLSMFASFTTAQEIDAAWKKLSEGGKVLMELQKYPFSEKFGWVSDRYGLSWQLNLGGPAATVTPFFMFVGRQHGKTEDAIGYWGSLFKDSKVEQVAKYAAGEPGAEGTVKHARFRLAGQEFMAMDSNREHDFSFTPGFSLFVDCRTQQEVDALWEKLSAGGSKGQCGWLEDKYGVSWQVVPTVLGEMLGDADPVRSQRVMQAMMQMRKLDIRGLQEAYSSAS
ncbi:MAG: VOC family protein [Spirochaetia bacterium]|jgi:predicted 3-demethylubiquinone-9 3-methyltransferase (glyoxalase superfamily)